MNAVDVPEAVTHERPVSVPEKHRGLAIALILLQNRLRIAATALIAMVLGGALAFSMKPSFLATATILPPQTPQSTAATLLAGQFGALGALGGAGGLLKNPSDTYVGILEGRTIADHIISQFHLQSRWGVKSSVDARKALQGHAQFEAAKNGLIVISVTDHDPKLASDMANAFVDQLYNANSELAITEAAQRRKFFDKELQEERQDLANAENALRATQEKTGLIELSSQSTITIRTIAQLEAEIKGREVVAEAMRTYATEQNPQLIQIQTEIATMRQQLARLRNDQRVLPVGDVQLPAGRVPAEGLEYIRKFREVKYHETLFELLSKQYEAARIDEAKSAPIIQVVDRAVPPDKKSGPPRMLITLGFGVFGFIIGCLMTFMKQVLGSMRKDPASAAQVEQLSALLRFRR